jgi:FkbM family methyltransferase
MTPEPGKVSPNRPVLRLASLAARLLPLGLKRRLYRSPLAPLIRQELNRAAPQGFSVVEITSGGLAGLRMSLDLHAEKDYWLGTYEPELLYALQDLVRPGWVAYDLGANIGYISLLLARLVGQVGRVYSFEALPANLERLRLNLQLNNLQTRVTIVPGAVGSSTQPVQFLVGPSDDTGKALGSAGRQELSYSQAISVPGVVLDEFVFTQDNPPPAVVKIDIEGGEVLALPGMRRILAGARPLVCLELHGPESAHLAWDILVASGYRLCRMAPGYPPIPSLEALDWKAYIVAFPPQ